MWIWRRWKKISWEDKKTNEKILNIVQEDRKILNTIWCRKHKAMGHVLWHDVLKVRMLGKRTRGRKIQIMGDLL